MTDVLGGEPQQQLPLNTRTVITPTFKDKDTVESASVEMSVFSHWSFCVIVSAKSCCP